ncbi:MAG: YdeI/OmpD-associated family protein, partial [Chloroflexia bacterium]|nr:YdeI/OmpD-associated family protein [Chloroflexia bacterium]
MKFRASILQSGQNTNGIDVPEVTVPLDFADALDRDLVARTFFDGLSYSNRLRHVLSVEGAKTPKTRQRRIDKAIESLREGNSSANNERVQPPSKPQFTG